MNYSKIIILAFLIWLPFKSFTQEKFVTSFIIDIKKDTIWGSGNINVDQTFCMFKKYGEHEYKKILPNSIESFNIAEGSKYVSKEIIETNGKSNWYFLEYLIDGSIDLFVLKKYDRYFIENVQNKIIELKDSNKKYYKSNGIEYVYHDNKYIGYLRSYFKDTPELFPRIDKMEQLSQDKLVKLAVDYHKIICDSTCINYTKKTYPQTIQYEILTGLNYHTDFYTPQIGILLHIWRPLKNENLFIKTGLIYSVKPSIRNNLQTYQSSLKPSYSLKIPLSFEYQYGHKNIKPIFAYGFTTGNWLISSLQGGFIAKINNNYEFTINCSIDGPLFLVRNMHSDVFDNNFGHSVNFGLIYKPN